MTEEFGFMHEGPEGNPGRQRHAAVDALMAGRNEVWVMVARPGENPTDLLWSGNAHADNLVPRVCRAVLEGGVLLLADADPEDDPLLSELLSGEDSGTA